ncbi:hypothetical protein PO413_13675, partial [Escherichia coli]
MFIRAPNSGRKLLLTCIVAGVMIAILVSCLQFLVAWHKHEVKYDTLITDVQKYLDTYGNDSNLLIVFYVQIMPDDFVMQLHR